MIDLRLRAGSLLLLVFLLGSATPAAGQNILTGKYRVDTDAKLTVPLRALARPRAYLPIEIEIRTLDALEGTVEVTTRSGGGEPPTRRPISVGRGSTHRISIPVRMGSWAATPRIVIRDRRGRYVRIDPGDLDQDDASSTPVAERSPDIPIATVVPLSTIGFDRAALHVAILGEDPLGWTMVREMHGGPVDGHPEALEGRRAATVSTLLPAEAPRQWFGWSGADIVVWHRPDPERLSPEQVDALLGFVGTGGTLVVSLDAGYATFARSAFGEAAGIEFSPLQSRPAVDVLARAVRPRHPFLPSERSLLVVGARPDLGTKVRVDVDGHPLVLERAVGGGRIVVLTFDVAAAALRGRVARDQFWRRLLGLNEPFEVLAERAAREGRDQSSSDHVAALAEIGTPGMAGIEFAATGTEALGLGWRRVLSEALEEFEGLNPLPVLFLVIFGVLYLVAIGPGDYFFVRRLGRPVLTWLTFPLVALGFSAVAIGVVSIGRTDGSVMKCLEIVDEMPTLGRARGSTFCSLWSSGRDDLVLSVPGVSAWTAPAAANEEYLYYGDAPTSYEDLVVVTNGRHVGFQLEVAPWSLTRFESAWVAEGGGVGTLRFERGEAGVHPLFEAEPPIAIAAMGLYREPSGSWMDTVERDTTDYLGRVRGWRPVVTNDTEHTFSQAWLLLGDRAWSLGTLAVGESKAVESSKGRPWQETSHNIWTGDLFTLAVAPEATAGSHMDLIGRGPVLVGWVEPVHPPVIAGDIDLTPDTSTFVRAPLAVEIPSEMLPMEKEIP
jgi:hypothetical protein